MFCDYSTLATLYKMGEVSFHFIGTNSFHIKAENERFSVVGGAVVITSNLTISRRRLADLVKKLHQRACCTCSTIIFSLFNQSCP